MHSKKFIYLSICTVEWNKMLKKIETFYFFLSGQYYTTACTKSLTVKLLNSLWIHFTSPRFRISFHTQIALRLKLVHTCEAAYTRIRLHFYEVNFYEGERKWMRYVCTHIKQAGVFFSLWGEDAALLFEWFIWRERGKISIAIATID